MMYPDDIQNEGDVREVLQAIADDVATEGEGVWGSWACLQPEMQGWLMVNELVVWAALRRSYERSQAPQAPRR